MIAVRLMGGLGNQMFQYAVARDLALKRKTNVALDMIFFDNIAASDTHREFELDCFTLEPIVLPPSKRPEENPEPSYLGKRGKLRRAKHHLQGKAWTVHREPHHNYDPAVHHLPNNSYLVGYWQSEKYFRDNRAAILKDFSFKQAPDGDNKRLLEQIQNCSESVSLHVRRGDYVTNQNASAFHGTKDQAYYDMALSKVTKKVQNPTIFVFSDDPEWCRDNLKFKYQTVYTNGNEKGYEDMRLMMQCKHNIIANSSFSWWAAWLNTNPDKIVVAPKVWFTDPSVNTSDVIPETWIRV